MGDRLDFYGVLWYPMYLYCGHLLSILRVLLITGTELDDLFVPNGDSNGGSLPNSRL